MTKFIVLVFCVLLLAHLSVCSVEEFISRVAVSKESNKRRSTIIQPTIPILKNGRKVDVLKCPYVHRGKEQYITLQSIIIKTDNENNAVKMGTDVIVEALWRRKSESLDVEKSHAYVQLLNKGDTIMSIKITYSSLTSEYFDVPISETETWRFYKTVIKQSLPYLESIKGRVVNLRAKTFVNTDIFDGCYEFNVLIV